jgi:hypothetical protein
MKITIDGVDYHVDHFSEAAQAQLKSLQFLDVQMQKISQEIAVYETARKAYLAALKAELATSLPSDG